MAKPRFAMASAVASGDGNRTIPEPSLHSANEPSMATLFGTKVTPISLSLWERVGERVP
jgi:hypothetical protein